MSPKNEICSGCGAPTDDHNTGVELWGSWFCSTCFISNAGKLHKELTPDDIALLRTIGRELAGFLPPSLLEMVLVGFHNRSKDQKDVPSQELARCVGEIQRLAAFSTFRQILNLLRTWHSMFTEFVDQQEAEIRDKVKRLTESE